MGTFLWVARLLQSVWINESCSDRHSVYCCCHSVGIKQRRRLSGTGSVSQIDTSPRLLLQGVPAETIATGRNRILFYFLCLHLPCLATAVRAAVNRGTRSSVPEHAIVICVIVVWAAVCRCLLSQILKTVLFLKQWCSRQQTLCFCPLPRCFFFFVCVTGTPHPVSASRKLVCSLWL